MKNLLALLSCIILLAACKSKDPTPITITGLDPIFEKYLVDKKIDKDGTVNGTMNSTDAIGVYGLKPSNLNIKSLVGIEYFVDLTLLYCDDNQLTNLDLSKNINLKSLECENNRLTNLDMSKNINLYSLGCFNNRLTNLGVNKNINLQHLGCGNNQLTNLDVSKNIGLQYLYCYSNQLSNLDVSKNINLQYLDCRSNSIKSICVNNIAKANTNTATKDANGDYYWQKDATATFVLCP